MISDEGENTSVFIEDEVSARLALTKIRDFNLQLMQLGPPNRAITSVEFQIDNSEDILPCEICEPSWGGTLLVHYQNGRTRALSIISEKSLVQNLLPRRTNTNLLAPTFCPLILVRQVNPESVIHCLMTYLMNETFVAKDAGLNSYILELFPLESAKDCSNVDLTD